MIEMTLEQGREAQGQRGILAPGRGCEGDEELQGQWGCSGTACTCLQTQQRPPGRRPPAEARGGEDPSQQPACCPPALARPPQS